VVSVSPDGRQLVLGSDGGSEAVIWIYELSGTSAPRRLTFQGRNRFPVWSNDGTYVAFGSDRDGDPGIFRQRADGTEVAERLTKAEKGTAHIPTSWAPDGSRLLYDSVTVDKTTLWSFTMSDRKAAPVGAIASGTPTGAVFSPDGRWIAYTSNEGRTSNAVFVEPFPPTGAKQQVSKDQDDGHHLVWTRDGAELLFTPGPGTRLSVVGVATRPTFKPVSTEAVLPRPFRNEGPEAVRPYDIAPDGRHIFGLVAPGAVAAGPLRIASAWSSTGWTS